MKSWELFLDSRFDLQFQYPSTSPNGESVERVETQREGLVLVHIISPSSREVYFEVSKYEAISAQEEYQRHKEFLPGQFHPLAITDLKEVVCDSLPAFEYTFEWRQGRRTVILVERKNTTYRILFNPRSTVNLQILSTLKWLKLP